MKRTQALRVLLPFLLVLGAGLASAKASGAASNSPVLSMKLSGVVDPFEASYIKRGIETANRNGDAAVLITIDTPGGLDSSMRDIIKSILGSRIPVICFTSPSGARAASAGTFVMMACPISAMAPGTNIGAAHPVGVADAIELEKVTNDAAAFIRSLADRWHRNADWAEKAVRDAVSVSAEEALRIHVVDFVAPSTTYLLVSDLLPCSARGAAGRPSPPTGLLHDQPGLCLRGTGITPFRMSIAEGLFHSFADPNVAFIFLEIGIIALIVWVIHPGLHVSLAVGIILSVLGFLILQTLPVRLVGLILLIVSAVLFVLDVKAKAHGVLTAGGLATMILGGLLLFNPSVPTARVSLPLLIGMAVAIALFMTFVVRAILSAKETPVGTGMEALEGSTGLTTTALDPKGLVRARGESWTAESLAGPIPAGTPVRIVGVKGVKLLVEPGAVPAGTAVGPTVKEGERT